MPARSLEDTSLKHITKAALVDNLIYLNERSIIGSQKATWLIRKVNKYIFFYIKYIIFDSDPPGPTQPVRLFVPADISSVAELL